MCSVTAVALVATAAYGAYSAREEGKAQEAAANFAAGEAERQSTEVGEAAADQRDITREVAAQDAALGTAQFAASGVDVGSSVVNIWEQASARTLQQDLDASATNQARTQSALRRGSQVSRATGRSAARAGRTRATASLLQGASQAAFTFDNAGAS